MSGAGGQEESARARGVGLEEKGSGTNLRNTLRASMSTGMQLVHKCQPTRTCVIMRTCVMCHAARTAGMARRTGSRSDVVVARLDAQLPHLCQQIAFATQARPKQNICCCLLVLVGLGSAGPRAWGTVAKRARNLGCREGGRRLRGWGGALSLGIAGRARALLLVASAAETRF